MGQPDEDEALSDRLAHFLAMTEEGWPDRGHCGGCHDAGMRDAIRALRGLGMLGEPTACVGQCRLSPDNSGCVGCGRTIQEIQRAGQAGATQVDQEDGGGT